MSLTIISIRVGAVLPELILPSLYVATNSLIFAFMSGVIV
jgi:hypothetical protein